MLISIVCTIYFKINLKVYNIIISYFERYLNHFFIVQIKLEIDEIIILDKIKKTYSRKSMTEKFSHVILQYIIKELSIAKHRRAVMGKDIYYTSEQYFKNRFDNVKQKFAFSAKNPDQYIQWKSELRSKLTEILGLDIMISCDLSAEKVEAVKENGYTREKIILQTEPDVFMPLYVLVPDGIKQGSRKPAVIAPHGHCAGGKRAIAGIGGTKILDEAIEQYNYDYGVQLVKKGFVVFCPDARGFGERREKYIQGDEDSKITSSSCETLNDMAIPLGQCVTGMWTWDLMRLLDYVQARNEVDKDKIGCAGLSGGGLQTLWLSALDDRIKCIVISGYFYGYKEALLEHQCCSCNYVPHLWEMVDIGDVGALIAPRPLLIETGDQDGLNGHSGLDNVTAQVDIVRKAMSLFGKEENIYHHIFTGGHRWNGEKAVPWLIDHLQLALT